MVVAVEGTAIRKLRQILGYQIVVTSAMARLLQKREGAQW